MGAKYTEAQKRATVKYISEKTEEIKVRVKKGQKQLIKEKAKKHGYSSLSKFILDAIENYNPD